MHDTHSPQTDSAAADALARRGTEALNSATSQRICVWCGVVMAVLFGIGFCLIARFLPPTSPTANAQQIADDIAEHRTSLRVGLALTAISAAFLGPFFAVITVQLKRVEGRHSPLAYTQLAMGAILVFEFIVPIFVMQSLIYREDRSLENTLLFSDMFWLMFVGVVTTGIVQFVATAIAILRDPREQPIYPRWVAYVNLWLALLWCSGNFVVFFKSGPFAWNGVASWWLVVVGFFVWLASMVVTTLAAITRQQAEEAASNDTLADDVDPSVRRRLERIDAELNGLRTVAAERC
jgi:hypothetical protein